jgi:hypothetical protein
MNTSRKLVGRRNAGSLLVEVGEGGNGPLFVHGLFRSSLARVGGGDRDDLGDSDIFFDACNFVRLCGFVF